MQVIVEKPYGRFSKGHIFTDMPANQARGLIKRGLVKEHGGEDEAGKTMRSPVNRMMRKSVKK